jgi:hypothetical protein
MTTGTITIGGSGGHTGQITIAPGTGAQTVDIAHNAGVKTVRIADGAAANVVSIGSATALATTTLRAGNAGMKALGVAGVAVSNKNYVTIDTVTGALGSDAGSGGTPALTWTAVAAGPVAMVANNGYVSNNAGLVTFTLPATGALGDVLEIIGNHATGSWTLAQQAGQTVHFGIIDTTVGVGGSLSSSARRDNVKLICTTINTGWSVVRAVGNLTYI